MERATILLAGYTLIATLTNVVLGAAVGFRLIGVRLHAWIAIPTNVLALFAWTVVVLYFLGAIAWVGEAVAEARLDSTLVAEGRAIHQGVLPWIAAAVAALIAAYVIGGGADTGAVPPWVHLLLGLLALALHVVAVYRTVVFVGMTVDLQGKVEQSATGS